MLSTISTAIVLATVAFIYWITRQKNAIVQAVLNWFPAILFAYVIPAVFTHAFHLDLSSVYLHNISRNWIIPLAIVTVMSALSMKQLKKVGLKPVALFVSGSFVIAVFPVLGVKSLEWISPSASEVFIGQDYWKGLVPIVGGWIGGSTSQLVLKELVNCPNEIFLSVIVLDNILVNLWTILMFQAIKGSDALNRLLRIGASPPENQIDNIETQISARSYGVTIVSVVISVLLVNFLTDNFLVRVIALSIVGLLFGNLIPQWNYNLALKAGSLSILVIMAILGLRLNFNQFLLPVPFLVLCIIWLIVHYVLLMFVSKLLNLHMAWVPVASMANLGGISTAPAVTAAYNKQWMPHAILLAILSMVTGNFWGMLTIYLFENF